MSDNENDTPKTPLNLAALFNGKTPVILQWGQLVGIIVAAIWVYDLRADVKGLKQHDWTSIDHQLFVEVLRNQNQNLSVPDVRAIKERLRALDEYHQ